MEFGQNFPICPQMTGLFALFYFLVLQQNEGRSTKGPRRTVRCQRLEALQKGSERIGQGEPKEGNVLASEPDSSLLCLFVF